jgi:hypothetical protein
MKKEKTPAELWAELERDPEYQRNRRKLEAIREAGEEEGRIAEAPLVEALATTGTKVSSVWDLVNTKAAYPAAVPVLFEHLRRPYPDRVMEGIVRALAIPESRAEWATLLELFQSRPAGRIGGVKSALSFALVAAADDDVIADIIALVSNPAHGEDRIPLLDALARSSSAEAHRVLEHATQDPQLIRYARVLLRRYRKHIEGTSHRG